MAATFESWVYPFVVIVTVPIGAVGGFIGLSALNLYVLQPLDVHRALGVVDEILEPSRTREAIARAIAAAPQVRGAHGNIPL